MRLRRPFVEVDGAVVVLTGASSGIGRDTALRLAGEGAKVVLAARGESALLDVRRQCQERGAHAIAVRTDVSDPDQVTELRRRAVDAFGRVDVWINNAGVMAYGTFSEVPMATHRQVIQTNLLGPIYGASEAISCFHDQEGKGVVINVASLYGEMTSPIVSSYVTSKFGLIGFCRALRRDTYPKDHIAVSCVLPGSIDTPIFRHAANYFGKETRAIPPAADPDRVARAIVRCVERPRKEVRIGYMSRVFALGERFVPPVYDRVVGPAFRFLGFRDAEAPADDGNVFEPAQEWNQIDGEWRHATARRAALGGVAALVAAGVVAARRH